MSNLIAVEMACGDPNHLSPRSDGHSFNSFASSLSGRSFFGKLNKYELKRKFYEKLEDFKRKVLVYKEPG
jgi:hypothetical protein